MGKPHLVILVLACASSAEGGRWFRRQESKEQRKAETAASPERKVYSLGAVGAPCPVPPRDLLRTNFKRYFMSPEMTGAISHDRLKDSLKFWNDKNEPRRYSRAADLAGSAWDHLNVMSRHQVRDYLVNYTLAQLEIRGSLHSQEDEESITHELRDELMGLEAAMAIPIDEMFLQILGPVFYAEIGGRYETSTKAGRIEQITAVLDLGVELKRKGQLKEFFVRMPKILPHEPTEHDFAMLYFERPERALPLAEELRK